MFFLDQTVSVSLAVYSPSLYFCGYIHYAITNWTWHSYNTDRDDILLPTLSYTLYLPSFWTLCLRVAWYLRCGFPVKETFSILIGHTRLARCLLVDHFWAMTNVTVLKMTTFIFNRAWQEKWKWKHRNSGPALKLKHRSVHKSTRFSTLSYRGFHGALSHTAAKCNTHPHNDRQTNVCAIQCAWRYG